VPVEHPRAASADGSSGSATSRRTSRRISRRLSPTAPTALTPASTAGPRPSADPTSTARAETAVPGWPGLSGAPTLSIAESVGKLIRDLVDLVKRNPKVMSVYVIPLLLGIYVIWHNDDVGGSVRDELRRYGYDVTKVEIHSPVTRGDRSTSVQVTMEGSQGEAREVCYMLANGVSFGDAPPGMVVVWYSESLSVRC